MNIQYPTRNDEGRRKKSVLVSLPCRSVTKSGESLWQKNIVKENRNEK